VGREASGCRRLTPGAREGLAPWPIGVEIKPVDFVMTTTPQVAGKTNMGGRTADR